MEPSHSYSESPTALTELEPSPVDETPSTYTSDSKDYFPATQSWTSGTTTLGISSNRVSYYLRQTQKLSSFTLPIFLTLHIANTSLIPLATRSLPDATSYLLLTRPYYQSFPLEHLLITLPLSLHISSGILLRLHHRRVLASRSARPSAPHLSYTSLLGYIATPLVLGHVALTRFLPWYVDGSSAGIGLDYVGHGVAATWPGPWVGYVGFAALVTVVGAHVVWGAATWAGVTPERVAVGVGGEEGRRRRRGSWWGVNAVAAVVVGVWAAGGLGVVVRGGKVGGWVGKGYDELLRRVPVLGWNL